ncbi:MAG: hypothetical protein ACOCUT_04030, partial [bacterium]
MLRSFSTLLVLCFLFQPLAYAYDPIEFSKASMLRDQRFQRVFEEATDKFGDIWSRWSERRQNRFVRNLEKIINKAERKISRMNDRRFQRRQARFAKKLNKILEGKAAPVQDDIYYNELTADFEELMNINLDADIDKTKSLTMFKELERNEALLVIDGAKESLKAIKGNPNNNDRKKIWKILKVVGDVILVGGIFYFVILPVWPLFLIGVGVFFLIILIIEGIRALNRRPPKMVFADYQ